MQARGVAVDCSLGNTAYFNDNDYHRHVYEPWQYLH